MSTPRAAIGFRVHSGWTALVAVAGPPGSFAVLDRRRIELADRAMPGAVQPYHAAEGMSIKQARAWLGRCRNAGQRLARKEFEHSISALEARGCQVVACGLLLSSARPLPDLATILGAHPLIHTAEGEFFRDLVVWAAESYKLLVVKVKERDLLERCQTQFRLSADELRLHLAEAGRTLGPPWQQDQKYAALAGLLALVKR